MKVPREKAQSEERATDRRKIYNYSVKNKAPKIIQPEYNEHIGYDGQLILDQMSQITEDANQNKS